MSPREQLDELHRRRTAREYDGVVTLATELWTEFLAAGGTTPEPGLAAACQATFVALSDAGRQSEAQLWRARATSTAALSDELNSLAMLMLPIAFQTIELPDPPPAAESGAGDPKTSYDVALEIMDEVTRLAEAQRKAGWSVPGVADEVVKRAHEEKSGYLCWRAGRYADAVAHYGRARDHVFEGTRDELRVDAGGQLARLGVEQDQTGTFDHDAARTELQALHERAVAGGWGDVDHGIVANLGLLDHGVTDVQDLWPVEIEARRPDDGHADADA